MNVYIGLDPGASGGLGVISSAGAQAWSFEKLTEYEIASVLRGYVQYDAFCYLEKVHSMPKQGVSSSFKFGVSYGLLRGIVVALGLPFETVTPQMWQKALGCLSRGDKRVTRAKAQELFPAVKATHAIADALLIAEFCRRVRA